MKSHDGREGQPSESASEAAKPAPMPTVAKREKSLWVQDIQSVLAMKYGSVREGIKMMEDIFLSMDVDDSEAIVESELVKTFDSMRLGFSRSEVAEIFAHYEQQGSLRYSQLIEDLTPPAPTVATALAELRKTLEKKLGSAVAGSKKLNELFDGMDVNEDGTLSQREFKTSLDKLRLELSPEETRVIFNEFDVDKTGFMNYKMLLEVLSPTQRTPEKLATSIKALPQTTSYEAVSKFELSEDEESSGDDDNSYSIRSKPTSRGRK